MNMIQEVTWECHFEVSPAELASGNPYAIILGRQEAGLSYLFSSVQACPSKNKCSQCRMYAHPHIAGFHTQKCIILFLSPSHT